MVKYEAMFIVKPDLGEIETKNVYTQIADVITKNSGVISNAAVWSEKRKMTFTIKKQQDGIYYLVNFTLPGDAITKIKYAFKLNDNILRVLITNVE
ncbi:MAG: 30S ribosomal protein S6 [Candidatus Omnitrophica bacterium]|jgi:small subunit ribosomal protein S6|nr:30S ribosomal protein S6 [Candidatus Omnitrophota bacterium]MDD5079905.1 30S ribosomal protein S6 [Candidatus Omnitrophota bacterium]